MVVLTIVGFVLAVLNPVIGGVLVGYIVWLHEPDIGFQIMMLSFFMLSLYGIGYVVWASRKIKKLEQRLALMEGGRK